MPQIKITSQAPGLRQQSPSTPSYRKQNQGPGLELPGHQPSQDSIFKRLLEAVVLWSITGALSSPWQPPGRQWVNDLERIISLSGELCLVAKTLTVQSGGWVVARR